MSCNTTTMCVYVYMYKYIHICVCVESAPHQVAVGNAFTCLALISVVAGCFMTCAWQHLVAVCC